MSEAGSKLLFLIIDMFLTLTSSKISFSAAPVKGEKSPKYYFKYKAFLP